MRVCAVWGGSVCGVGMCVLCGVRACAGWYECVCVLCGVGACAGCCHMSATNVFQRLVGSAH